MDITNDEAMTQEVSDKPRGQVAFALADYLENGDDVLAGVGHVTHISDVADRVSFCIEIDGDVYQIGVEKL